MNDNNASHSADVFAADIQPTASPLTYSDSELDCSALKLSMERFQTWLGG